MSIARNEEIFNISKKLDGCASEFDSFFDGISDDLNTIASSIIDSKIVDTWHDAVCIRTVNILNTIKSLTENKSVESKELLRLWKSLVNSLNNTADEYVFEYNSYASSVYYKDSPPDDIEDEEKWRNIKRAKEKSIRELEEKIENIKKDILAVDEDKENKYIETIVDDYNAESLTGKEFEQFCEKNLLHMEDVDVKKANVNIGGATFSVYYVYDKRLDDFDSLAFNAYVGDCIRELSKIDENVLRATSDTNLIFKQSYLVGGSNIFACASYYPDDNSIKCYFPLLNDLEEYVESILHEFGHSVDHHLYLAEHPEEVNQSNLNENSDDDLTSLSDDFEQWIKLAEDESDSFKNAGFKILCPSYDKEFFLENESYGAKGFGVCEYFAEAFNVYFYSDEYREKLRIVAPNTCAQIENSIERLCANTNND